MSGGIGVALRVLRAEGPRGFAERLLGRAGEWRRARAFTSPKAGDPPLAAPILNVLGTPPWPHLGGVQLQLAERLAAERKAAERPLALLYPLAGRYRLEVASGDVWRALDLGPIGPSGSAFSPLVLTDPAFERAVRAAAVCVDAAAIHLENPAGLPVGSLVALAEGGREEERKSSGGKKAPRWIVSVHDFSLFCPRPHLIEEPAGAFCHYSMDPGRCAACLGQDLQVPLGWQEERRALSRRLLDAAVAVVHPSDFLRRQMLELFPGLDAGRHHVIPPPFRRETNPPVSAVSRTGPPRHVAFAGSVQPHKGALVFEEVVRRLGPAHREVRWSVFGGGDAAILKRLRRRPARVAVRGFYRPGTLARRLVRSGVELVLLPSIWPETYSLALEECADAGLPVLAFDLGAPADRIREQGGGLLVPPAGGAAAMAEVLGGILADRTALPAPRATIHSTAGEIRLATEGERAAIAWTDLYRRLGLPL